MPLFLFILMAAAILLLLSGGYMFFIGCYAGKKIDWLDEEKLKGTRDEIYIECIRSSVQWLKENHARDIYVKSPDGLRLHGLWIPAENPKGTVLMAHGYRSTMLIDLHLGFELFHQLGFNVLVPEQRAHGQSQGKYITFGVKESRDMIAWLKYYRAELGQWPVILYGISMGASTMLYLADQKLPAQVCGIIADCGFTSPAAILSHVYRRVIRLPAAPTVAVAQLFAKVLAGFSLWEKDTRKILNSSCYPVLLIHGEADGFVPCEMTRQAYAVCKDPKKMLLVKTAEHGLSFLIDPKSYSGTVIDFLRKYVPGYEQ